MRKVAIAFICFSIIYSCVKEEIIDSPDVKLEFSSDTISFDTVFSTIGSITKHFTIRNTYNQAVKINQITLAGGNNSPFRMNVNGIADDRVSNVVLPSKDSIYIFVEVTVDPTNVNNPLLLKDSIVFSINGNIQDVNLEAYGQDFHLFKGEVLHSQTWENDKPYLIYNSVIVDSLETLKIKEGCQVHFHKKSSLLVKGTLKVEGSLESPVVFQGDRLEEYYENIPGQWGDWLELEGGGIYILGGIHFLVGSKSNEINYAVIKNAHKGIQIDSIVNNDEPTLRISNSRVENMTLNCIDARSTSLYASNCVFANSGSYALALLFGGSYEFYHCTVANFYSHYVRNDPALLIKNYFVYDNVVYAYDLTDANFTNCIIYGDYSPEIIFDHTYNGTKIPADFNYHFDHCLLKSLYESQFEPDKFTNSIFDEDPLFVDFSEYNYAIDSLSPAINMGNVEIGSLFPFDLNENSRTQDDAPDIGAYEWIGTKQE